MKTYIKSLFFLLLATVVCAFPLFAENRYALVIGNSKYEVRALPNPVNDARLLAKSFASAGFTVNLALDLDLKGMRNTIRDFSDQLKPGDVALFYFAGHGVQSGDSNWLIPINNADLKREDEAPDLAINMRMIMDKFKIAGTSLNIIFLDACRDNPFAVRSTASRGLQVVAAPSNSETVIFYAAEPGTVVPDGEQSNSWLAIALSAEIAKPAQDLPVFMNNVASAVRKASAKTQNPRVDLPGLSQPFYFSTNPTLTNVVITTTPVPSVVPTTKTLHELVRVEGGIFNMGANAGDSDADKNESPAHAVSVSNFYMSRYETTVAQFKRFTEETGYKTIAELEGGTIVPGVWDFKADISWKNPDHPQTDRHPVSCISWYDAITYCNWLSHTEGLMPVYEIDTNSIDMENRNSLDNYNWRVSVNTAANGYRLPTEAEWEWAARGGKNGKQFHYIGGNAYNQVAVYSRNSPRGPQPVGSKIPNELGINDLAGNIWEWCSDLFAPYPENALLLKDPKGPVKSTAAPIYYTNLGEASGAFRVLRGGGWTAEDPFVFRASQRNYTFAANTMPIYGFRVVKPVTAP